ncbi:MAG: hypothetical protein WC543_00930 [Candidatus Omnitrophota bacterium]
MLKQKNLGQSTAEYAIVIGLVIAAVVAMQIYVKRGLQAKMRDAVMVKGDGADTLMTNEAYEPDYSSSSMDIVRTAAESTEMADQGKVIRTLAGKGGAEYDVTTRKGDQSTSTLASDGVKR